MKVFIIGYKRPECVTAQRLTEQGIPFKILLHDQQQADTYVKWKKHVIVTNAPPGKFNQMRWIVKNGLALSYFIIEDDIDKIDYINENGEFSDGFPMLKSILDDDDNAMYKHGIGVVGYSKTSNKMWRQPYRDIRAQYTNMVGSAYCFSSDYLHELALNFPNGYILEDLIISLKTLQRYGKTIIDHRMYFHNVRHDKTSGYGSGRQRILDEMAEMNKLIDDYPFFHYNERKDGKGFRIILEKEKKKMPTNRPGVSKKVDKVEAAAVGGLKLEEGYYASPRWTYEILDCTMPMTFDTYSNCAHQCLYCFSFFQRAVGDTADDYLHHKVRAVNVDRVIKMFQNPTEYGGQFANYIKRRMVLQWGGLSDGFDFYERKFRASLKLLKYFCEIDYPISISTKGVWFLDDPEYVEVLRGAKNVHFKYSIITTIEDHVKKLEPGVPSAKERFRALERLSKLGIGATTLRFRPFVLGTSDKCIEDMMTRAEDAGCYSVTTEFLTWESRASNTSRDRLNRMSETLGYDLWKFYQENSARASGLLRLNYDLKRPYILEMKESAARHNLKFFVSDAHHKEESYHAGCCGLPESGPLSNGNRGQYAEAILIAKKNGFVKWSDISKMAEEALEGIPLYQAEGFPTDSMERAKRRYQNMYDYMHDVWNTPNSWQSPNRYFGGSLVAGGVDENGDVIYLYNKPFIEEGLRIGTVNELALQLRMVGKPNQDRYDEMVADGTNFGHVAYPIFVLSSGRWATSTTMNLLDKEKINYTLIVPVSQWEKYENKYPTTDIIVVDDETKGMGATREFVYEYCKEQGYPNVWMLDDDIAELKNDKGETTTFRALMSAIERFAGDYSNISLVGPNTGQEYNSVFTVNDGVRGFMLVNLLTGVEFNKDFNVYEDIAFVLDNLEKRFVSVVHNQWFVTFATTPGGGAGTMYLRNKEAQVINAMYPEHTETVGDNSVRKLIVNWDTFQQSLMSRNVELLMKGE